MSGSEHDSSSSDEDEDYVPEEYDTDEEDSGDGEKQKVSVKMAVEKTRVRQRSGIKLDDADHNITEDDCEGSKQDLEEEEILLKQQKEIAAKKEKEEDLWAAFKRDTGMLASNSSKATLSEMPSSSGKKVSITKTYDFAGEAVIVTKAVDEDSLEASYMKKKETKKAEPNHSVTPVGCVGCHRLLITMLPDYMTSHKYALFRFKSICHYCGRVKRAGGLSSVLGQIGKKAKLSTLEKSKLDWNMFKEQEGIQEELQNFNKDGYLEKQAFLKRTDERQFEMERDIRQGTRKR